MSKTVEIPLSELKYLIETFGAYIAEAHYDKRSSPSYSEDLEFMRKWEAKLTSVEEEG